MSKRKKIRRMTQSFDGRAYAESRRLDFRPLSDEEISRALESWGQEVRETIVTAVLHAAHGGMNTFLGDMMECIEMMNQTVNEEERYPDEFPGKTLDEHMASWDALIREVRDSD